MPITKINWSWKNLCLSYAHTVPGPLPSMKIGTRVRLRVERQFSWGAIVLEPAHTNPSLKDSFSGMLCYLKTMFSFIFFNANFVHNRRLEIWQDLETMYKTVSWNYIQNMSRWQKNLNPNVIFKNRSLVCKLHTRHVTQSMTSTFTILSQEVSVVQISNSYHI